MSMPDVLAAAAGYINQIATLEIPEPVEVKPGVVEALNKEAERARNKLNGMIPFRPSSNLHTPLSLSSLTPSRTSLSLLEALLFLLLIEILLIFHPLANTPKS